MQLLVLVPPFIAAMLAMLLSAFRGQNVMDITTVLAAVLVARQYTFYIASSTLLLLPRQIGLFFGAVAVVMLAGKMALRIWKRQQLAKSAKVAGAGLI